MVSKANEAIILCGGVSPGEIPPNIGKVVLLSTFGKGANINLKIQDISERLSAKIPDVWADLLDIAVYVYSADQMVTRGGSGITNLGAKWPRRFYFKIPVRDQRFWSRLEVQEQIMETLGFLSDDDYHFEFSTQPDLPPLPEFIEYAAEGKTYHEADTIMLFSGGLDSLAGAVQEIITTGNRTVLVSHRTTGKLAGPTADLVTLLRQKSSKHEPIFIPVWANKSDPASDFNQRTRSFIYASLGAIVASIFGHNKFKFYENGVTSINLPIAEQLTSTHATRSTHPKVIAGYRKLFSMIADAEFNIETPFLWKTKTEVVSLIGEKGCQDLIGASRSCSRTIQSTREKSHCGVCSQCIDRRFATLAAGLGEFDPADKYGVDLLIGAREKDEDRTMAESVVRTAHIIKDLPEDEIFIKFSQLNHVLPHVGLKTQEAADSVEKLLRRHAEQICRVTTEGLRKYAPECYDGILPETCLIVLAWPERYKATASEKSDERIFKKENGAWRVIFEGIDIPVKHSKGMYYLYELLTIPNERVAHDEMWGRFNSESGPELGPREYSTMGKERLEEEGLYDDTVKLEDINNWDKLKACFQKEFRRINAEIKEAGESLDNETLADLNAKKASLTSQWNKFFDRNGNPRAIVEKTPFQRRKRSVNTAIRRAIRDINKVNNPLANHLHISVKISPVLSYSPLKPTVWNT